MQGPLSNHFAKVVLGNNCAAQDICAQVLKGDLPVLGKMVDLWHDSLDHDNYAQLCTADMAAMLADLFEGLSVGRFVDLVDMEHHRFRHVSAVLSGFDYFEDIIAQLHWRNDLLGNCLRDYGTGAQQDSLGNIVSRTNTLRILMKSWKSLAKNLELETESHRLWQDNVLLNDADGLYGRYNDLHGTDNVLQVLVQERKLGLLKLQVAYRQASLVKHDISNALLSLRAGYGHLLSQTGLEISSIIGDKGPVPAP